MMNLQADLNNTKTLTEKVFQNIRNDIIEGRYKTGDDLIETKLAEEFGVSRTPIREALKQLELEGLVKYTPNRGVIVHGISKQDIDDILIIRYLLEGQAAYWAAQRITGAKLNKLTEIVELMELYTRRNDPTNLARLDTEFHEVIFSACESRMLEHILVYLHQNAQQARFSSFNAPHRPKDSLQEHQNILAAIERHNPDEAKTQMERHIFNVSKNMAGKKENE